MSKDVTTFVDVQENGDEFISEYGNGWQRAYVITKAELDFMKEQAKL